MFRSLQLNLVQTALRMKGGKLQALSQFFQRMFPARHKLGPAPFLTKAKWPVFVSVQTHSRHECSPRAPRPARRALCTEFLGNEIFFHKKIRRIPSPSSYRLERSPTNAYGHGHVAEPPQGPHQPFQYSTAPPQNGVFQHALGHPKSEKAVTR